MVQRTTIVGLFVLFGAAPLSVRGEAPVTQPWEPVTHRFEARVNPPTRLHVVTVDLNDPDVALRVSRGGDDPDGPRGQWHTTLLDVPAIAVRDGYEIAINGDFFRINSKARGLMGRPQYETGVAAAVIGPAMTDGASWGRRDLNQRPAVIVHADGHVSMEQVPPWPPGARQVIAGNALVVRNGRSVAGAADRRDPRTAVGIDEAGRRLVLLVVDGRRPWSVGMTMGELAAEMVRLGCHTAINLDGGGSTTLVLGDPDTGGLRVLNEPSDGRPRPVANVLGVDIAGAAEPATTQPSTRP